MDNENLPDNIKILIVDDREENLVAMKKTLAPLKLDIKKANSGNEALKIMLEEDFAVVLLDVMMPDMNGFEVAALMQENDVTKHLPIIFITAINKSDDYYIKGMEAGAIDYLYKPIDPIILLSKVRVFVDLYTVRNRLEKTIAQLHEFQQQLQTNNMLLKQLSEEDMLTKTSNRRHFEEESNNLLAKCIQEHKSLGLLFIDVDDFKHINDTYGHRIGDQVLIKLADRLKYVGTAPEVTAANVHLDMISRLGGDEFAMIVTGVVTAETAAIVAKTILNGFAQPFTCDGQEISVTISIGFAIAPNCGKDLAALLHAADGALYQSKEAGKNTYFLAKA